jgi:hypothetical protein
MSGDFASRVTGFFPWGPVDGLPEASVPGVMYGNEWWIPARQRFPVKLRVLADGRPQLLVPASGRTRVTVLGQTVTHIDILPDSDAPSERWITDAVLSGDQSIIVLERVGRHGFVVKQARADGTPGWELDSADQESRLGEDPGHARLLSGPGGRIYLASRGGSPYRLASGDERSSLFRVDDGSGDCLYQWKGPDPVMLPDGGMGFARYGSSRNRVDWVQVNLDTGAEVVVESDQKLGSYLNKAIGVDDDGNVFGSFAGALVRMRNAAERDWSLTLNGIVVSEQHGITAMSLSAKRDEAWLDDGHRIAIDLGRGNRRGYLVNRTDDGGYVLYQRTRGDFGTLLYLDHTGEHVRSEPAPEDVWFTSSQAQEPSAGSVTRDGEVLVAVLGSAGVHVVGIRPGQLAPR